MKIELPKASGVYQIKSIKTEKIYIGSACNIQYRIKQGHIWPLSKNKHDNIRVQSHVNRYGLNDLVFSVLELCAKNKLIEKEQYYINNLKPKFNISPIAGSQLGMKHSEESKQKMRNAHKNRSEKVNKHHGKTMEGKKNPMFGKHPIPWNKGKKGVQPCSDETKKKMSIVRTGKTIIWSKEAKQRHSEQAKKRFSIKENNPMFGKKHSKESKLKMSIARKGILKGIKKGPQSNETKKKISVSLLKYNRKKEIRN